MILKIWTTFLRLFLYFTAPVSEKVLDFLYSIFARKTKPLPAIRNRILLMSARELAEAIRKRKLTSEEVVTAYIERIKEVDPIINACVDHRFEAATEDARSVDRMLQKDSRSEEEIEKDTPLLGVPFSCKEIVGVKGLAQTLALKRYRDRKAPADADAVALYRQAGAIPLVVTNIPTITMWWNTSNYLFGLTRNPYNHHRMVGGSSGGEAAVLAYAGAVIGIGTDIGGSIRIPASLCGIYGHKPSRGVISNHRHTPTMNMKLDHFRTTGPMCRYADDISLLVKILSGKDSGKMHLDKKVDFRKISVYYIESFPGFFSSSADVKAAVRKAVKHFQDEFDVIPTELKINELASSFDIWQYKFLEADGSPLLPDITDENGKVNWPWQCSKSILGLSEYDIPLVYFATVGKRHKSRHYYECLKKYAKIERIFKEYLSNEAILLLPTFPERPPHVILSIPKMENTGYTTIFNILGLPVTQIPAGFSKGLPIGIQAVAGLYKDYLTLAAASELHKVFGGWKSPCPVEI